MSFDVRPGSLDSAISNWLETNNNAGLRVSAEKLTHAYRQGRSSSQVDLAAYLTVRMPATFAAIGHVLARTAAVMQGFAPSSILDVGAGPGTASWAALAQWSEISNILMVEADTRFAQLAKDLANESSLPALQSCVIEKKKLTDIETKADLVIAAYVFAELEDRAAGDAALKLWTACNELLVIIEPGTPRGFARINRARAALLGAGANIIGPCTHANTCPMNTKDWCHFTQRLARSRAHMHGKAATVPFEDEPFSWIAVSRKKHETQSARIIAPPETTKINVELKLCRSEGISILKIASREKQAYKQAKKLEWGDCL